MHFNQLVNNPRKLRSLCTNFKLQTVALGGHGFKTLWGLNSVCLESRDLKIRRRRRQRERHKSNSFNNHARVSRFSVHFFAVTARLRNFLPLSELGSWFLGIQLSKGLPTLILTKLVTWSNRDEDWRTRIHIFSDRRLPRILRSLVLAAAAATALKVLNMCLTYGTLFSGQLPLSFLRAPFVPGSWKDDLLTLILRK